jgi:hydrogenase-4 component H
MKLPCLFQFRVLKLAVTSLFSRPYTTRFPKEPYEPIEEFRGRPRFNPDTCIGCGACAEVCPSQCIDVIDMVNGAPPMRRLVQHLDACICCGQCERHCTVENGITLTNEWDFVGFKPEDFEESIEKELVLCESCGKVVAPVDQLRWLSKRLGPLAYANTTLMLTAQKDLGLVDETVIKKVGETERGSHLRVQCPSCRRKSALVV